MNTAKLDSCIPVMYDLSHAYNCYSATGTILYFRRLTIIPADSFLTIRLPVLSAYHIEV